MLGKKQLLSGRIFTVLTLKLSSFMFGCYVNFQISHGGIHSITLRTWIPHSFMLGFDVKHKGSGGGQNITTFWALSGGTSAFFLNFLFFLYIWRFYLLFLQFGFQFLNLFCEAQARVRQGWSRVGQ